MYPALNRCPVCKSELTVTRLHCQSCDTVLEGRFTSGPFVNLSAPQLEFVITFVRCEGKINRVEEELGLSYPTIRNRLHEVIRALGFEPGKEDTPDVTDEKRRIVLEDLDGGKISAEEAMRLLRGEESEK
ncbi:MAG: DUF2089 domain-containing protein [Anaerolineales bacterium]|nr:DUF2089 domain-containing protein [Anaerolineales bacterium]